MIFSRQVITDCFVRLSLSYQTIVINIIYYSNSILNVGLWQQTVNVSDVHYVGDVHLILFNKYNQ